MLFQSFNNQISGKQIDYVKYVIKVYATGTSSTQDDTDNGGRSRSKNTRRDSNKTPSEYIKYPYSIVRRKYGQPFYTYNQLYYLVFRKLAFDKYDVVKPKAKDIKAIRKAYNKLEYTTLRKVFKEKNSV